MNRSRISRQGTTTTDSYTTTGCYSMSVGFYEYNISINPLLESVNCTASTCVYSLVSNSNYLCCYSYYYTAIGDRGIVVLFIIKGIPVHGEIYNNIIIILAAS